MIFKVMRPLRHTSLIVDVDKSGFNLMLGHLRLDQSQSPHRENFAFEDSGYLIARPAIGQ